MFLTITSLVTQGQNGYVEKESSASLTQHLEEYSSLNQTHHDNIDDTPHSHSHRHSEDGEEHEHHHEHKKILSPEIQIFASVENYLSMPFLRLVKNHFREPCSFSQFYLKKLLRPPIS